MKLSAFHTRDLANQGKKVPLYLPDGTKTEEYIVVRSRWSDQVQQANRLAAEKIKKFHLENPNDDLDQAIEDAKQDVLVASIAGWSCEDEFTPEAVKELLIAAPQLAAEIDRIGASDTRFFQSASSHSSDGSSES